MQRYYFLITGSGSFEPLPQNLSMGKTKEMAALIFQCLWEERNASISHDESILLTPKINTNATKKSRTEKCKN